MFLYIEFPIAFFLEGYTNLPVGVSCLVTLKRFYYVIQEIVYNNTNTNITIAMRMWRNLSAIT